MTRLSLHTRKNKLKILGTDANFNIAILFYSSELLLFGDRSGLSFYRTPAQDKLKFGKVSSR